MNIEYNPPNERELEVGDILVLKNTEDISWIGNMRMICKSKRGYQLVALDKNYIIPRKYSSLEDIMKDENIQKTLIDTIKSDNVKLVVNQPQKINVKQRNNYELKRFSNNGFNCI